MMQCVIETSRERQQAVRIAPACNAVPRLRRASVYPAVLIVSLVVASLAVAGSLSVRIQTRTATMHNHDAEARQIAQAALDLGRLWIDTDANWRNRGSGAWATNQPMGNGTYTLEVSDPTDGDLANRPHDPVVLRATGMRGSARHILEVTLTADPVPLDILRYAAFSAGQFRIKSGKSLAVTTGIAATNGTLLNEGILSADVEAGLIANLGTINGNVTLLSAAKPTPASTIAEAYAALGRLIEPGTSIDKQVISPSRNPWGNASVDGVYVVRTNGDLTIKDSRIHGTLVVICPGRKVVVDGNVLLHSFRPDYPVLIVDGNLELKYTSGSALSESSLGVNFNPPGAPYQGQANWTTTDVYPSEIQGLVHARGTVRFSKDSRIRGALICESTASPAIDVNDSPEILYDSTLFSNPPQWYTTSVKMKVQPGSYKRIVD